jgi:cold shock protein
MRKHGVLKFYNYSKGFGFIAREDGGKHVFVHASALGASGMPVFLSEGDKISIESRRRPRRRRRKQGLDSPLIGRVSSILSCVRQSANPANDGTILEDLFFGLMTKCIRG